MKFKKQIYTPISEKFEELSEYLQELFDKYRFSHVEDISWDAQAEGSYWGIFPDVSDCFYRIKVTMDPEIYENFLTDFKKIIPHIEKRMSSNKIDYNVIFEEYPPSKWVFRGSITIWIRPIKRKNFIKRFLDL